MHFIHWRLPGWYIYWHADRDRRRRSQARLQLENQRHELKLILFSSASPEQKKERKKSKHCQIGFPSSFCSLCGRLILSLASSITPMEDIGFRKIIFPVSYRHSVTVALSPSQSLMGNYTQLRREASSFPRTWCDSQNRTRTQRKDN